MIGLFVGSILDEILLLFSALFFSSSFSSSIWRFLFFAYVHDSFFPLLLFLSSGACFVLDLVSYFFCFSSLLNQYAAFIRQEIEENIIAWGVFLGWGLVLVLLVYLF